MSGEPVIAQGTEADLPSIAAIYNHYVRTTHVTFDLDPVTVEDRRAWLSHYACARHRLLIARSGDVVVGYATSSPWRPRPAYEPSVETSVYIAPDLAGRGIGTALYAALFQILDGADVHRAYAGIALPNDASVALHERFGFRRAGLFTEQGRKFGRWWDVAWYEKTF